MRGMQQRLGNWGTISAFARRHRETKKNLCRGGRSQDLPDSDFQPAVQHLKYVTQQYTHSTTNTHKMTTIHTRQIQLTKMHIRKTTPREENNRIQFLIFFPTHAFTPDLHFSPLYYPYIPFPLRPAFTPSLRCISLHFHSLYFTTLLDDIHFTSLPFTLLHYTFR